MSTQQPDPSAPQQSTYGANRSRGTRGGGRGYRGTGERGSRGGYRGRGRGDSSRGGGENYYDRNREGTNVQYQNPKSVQNLPTAESQRPGPNSANRFAQMMGGSSSAAGRGRGERKAYQGTKPSYEDKNKSAAAEKFDALFGGSAPSDSATGGEAVKQAVDIESILEESLAPRKQSNVDSAHNEARDTRKESNVSASSGNRQLNALFGGAGGDDAAIVSVATSKVHQPRKRYTKDDLLSRFRQTMELDMTVFEPERMLDYADLFVSHGSKPTFTKAKKAEDADEEKDPFDDMADEAKKESDSATQGGLVPESITRTEKQPDHPLQQKGGAYQGYNNNRNYQNKNYNNNQHKQQQYRSGPATNFAAYDEDEDEDPEWGDFDPEKETGNFFGREIPEEIQLRNQLEEQRTRWGGAGRKAVGDDEDEFDAMMEEESAAAEPVQKKEIGQRPVQETSQNNEEELENAEDVAEYSASKTLDEISEEVPQDIKNKIIDLEAEQQEKLRATMLKNTFQPKTSALQNLQGMFSEYPVVTNESLKLKMETIGQIQTDSDNAAEATESDEMNAKQLVFSRLLTSINPFAQFIILEMVQGEKSITQLVQNWELDVQILQRHPDEQIKKEHLLKTSSEMFSIYLYTKDPSMRIKSDKYTNGEFKMVKDLVNVEDSLLVSSQMANSLLLLNQHEKMMKDAQQKMNESAAAAPDNTTDSKKDDSVTGAAERNVSGTDEAADNQNNNDNEKVEESQSVAAPAAVDENDVLADLNNQLKNMLM